MISFDQATDAPTKPFVRAPTPAPARPSTRRLGRLAWHAIVAVLVAYVAFVGVLILVEVLT